MSISPNPLFSPSASCGLKVSTSIWKWLWFLWKDLVDPDRKLPGSVVYVEKSRLWLVCR